MRWLFPTAVPERGGSMTPLDEARGIITPSALFDYSRRAQPFNRPGSLTDDEVYALTAWLLFRNQIIAADQVIDAETLPKVQMPNRDGFVPDPRPDVD